MAAFPVPSPYHPHCHGAASLFLLRENPLTGELHSALRAGGIDFPHLNDPVKRAGTVRED